MDMEGLWGVFGSSANRNGGSFLQTDPTLGWPFGTGYNTTGMGIARESVNSLAGTLGGYLTYDDAADFGWCALDIITSCSFK